jgi:uncharacterized protein (DUF2225 family)
MNSITLNPQEAQLVVSILTQIAGIQQDYRQQTKSILNTAWVNSEKDTEDGQAWFNVLNYGKTRYRQSKVYEAKVNNLIRKIRKDL